MNPLLTHVLMQWRAYGDDGAGVAIGIDFQAIRFPDPPMWRDHPQKQPFSIRKVRYGLDEMVGTFEEVLSEFENKAKMLIDENEVNQDSATILALLWLRRVGDITASFKSDSYKHEAEWRVIYQPPLLGFSDIIIPIEDYPYADWRMNFDTSSGVAKPYYELTIEPDTMKSIVIGPDVPDDHFQTTLKYLLRRHGVLVKEDLIRSSSIAYRRKRSW